MMQVVILYHFLLTNSVKKCDENRNRTRAPRQRRSGYHHCAALQFIYVRVSASELRSSLAAMAYYQPPPYGTQPYGAPASQYAPAQSANYGQPPAGSYQAQRPPQGGPYQQQTAPAGGYGAPPAQPMTGYAGQASAPPAQPYQQQQQPAPYGRPGTAAPPGPDPNATAVSVIHAHDCYMRTVHLMLFYAL